MVQITKVDFKMWRKTHPFFFMGMFWCKLHTPGVLEIPLEGLIILRILDNLFSSVHHYTYYLNEPNKNHNTVEYTHQ